MSIATKRMPLPAADQFGNYWFPHLVEAGVNIDEVPAIFMSKSVHEKAVHHNGTYFVQLGRRGMLWDGPKLRKFVMPTDAAEALADELAVGYQVPEDRKR